MTAIGFPRRWRIQIREMPVRLPTDPTIAGRAIKCGDLRYLLHRRKADASEDASYDCLMPASKIKSGREFPFTFAFCSPTLCDRTPSGVTIF